MTSGVVRGLVPTVPLTLEDRDGRLQRFQFAVDTGFTGALSLPEADLQRLQVTPLREDPVVLADGSSRMCGFYRVAVYWHGARHEIPAYGLGRVPLLGMRLLNGSRVGIDVVEGGPVSVEPLQV